MLCDVKTLSRPQTMRRQRTEVVVELRKVNGSGLTLRRSESDARVFMPVTFSSCSTYRRTRGTSTF